MPQTNTRPQRPPQPAGSFNIRQIRNPGISIHERASRFSSTARTFIRRRCALGFEIDYRKLLELFGSQGRLVRAFYYTALLDDQEYSPLRPLVDWLDYNG